MELVQECGENREITHKGDPEGTGRWGPETIASLGSRRSGLISSCRSRGCKVNMALCPYMHHLVDAN